MARYLATYEFKESRSGQAAFIEAARAKGWSDWATAPANDVRYRLPTTTLVGEFGTIDDATSSFRSIAGAVPTGLMKAAAPAVAKFMVVEIVDDRLHSDESAPN